MEKKLDYITSSGCIDSFGGNLIISNSTFANNSGLVQFANGRGLHMYVAYNSAYQLTDSCIIHLFIRLLVHTYWVRTLDPP